MRMVNDELSLSFYRSQDDTFLLHNHPQQSESLATGWLFFSIALGSLFTFTFFAALSTSFYCCDKTRKDPDESTDEGCSEQKLFFPNVPSTVYPTTHFILQQEQNEVVESLSEAYRELPSSHFSYSSGLESTVTVDQTSSENSTCAHLSSTYPNSNNTSNNYNTTSSSKQLASTTIDPNPSIVISIRDCTCERYLRSQSAPMLENDSNISIRVGSPRNPDACMTSSTSGILTGENLTTQTIEEKTMILENTNRQDRLGNSSAIISRESLRKNNQGELFGQQTSELLKKEQDLPEYDRCNGCPTKPESTCLRAGEKRCQSCGSYRVSEKQPNPQTRSFSESGLGLKSSNDDLEANCFLEAKSGKQEAKTFNDSRGVYEDEVTYGESKLRKNTMIYDSSRGASSFGGDGGSNGTSQSNYYTLTFPREESILLDNGGNLSVRGASAFACQDATRAKSHESRGASSLGIISDSPRSKFGTPCHWEREVVTERNGFYTNTLGKRDLGVYSTRSGSRESHRLPKPITNVDHVPRDNTEPMRGGQSIQDCLNTTMQQSLGSMKMTSPLEVDESFLGKYYDNDTLGESISLSFAYESASDDSRRN